MSFGLSPFERSEFERLVVEPLKRLGAKVWVFGSRARGDHRAFSDVDVLYEAQSPISWAEIGRIKEEIDDSNFPFKVDLVALPELAESYKNQILAERRPIE